jgi:CII-binding regulator of phage lambda lysogenization HflD
MSLLFIEEKLKKDIIAIQANRHRVTETISYFSYYSDGTIDITRLNNLVQIFDDCVFELQNQIKILKDSEQYKEEWNGIYAYAGSSGEK